MPRFGESAIVSFCLEDGDGRIRLPPAFGRSVGVGVKVLPDRRELEPGMRDVDVVAGLGGCDLDFMKDDLGRAEDARVTQGIAEVQAQRPVARRAGREQ